MGSLVIVVLLLIGSALAYFAWQLDSSPESSGVTRTNRTPLVPIFTFAAGPLQSRNGEYLADVRHKSCYPVLRNAHTFLTVVAIAAVGILWIVLLSNTDETLDGIYATFACAGVITALLIEYGLFRLIVDAVDVLIDGTRRKGEGQ